MTPLLPLGCLRRGIVLILSFVLLLVSIGAEAKAQDAPDTQAVGPLSVSKAKPQTQPEETPQEAPVSLPPTAVYDRTIFQAPLPSASLAFLKSLDGVQTKDVYHDKQFKAVKKAALPGWMFHYGRDMPVSDAMDAALGGSKDAVTVRDGRYVMLSGTSDLYPGLQGRGFLWIDLEEGITLGGFYFHPTNGEPTPTMTVFSRQLDVETLSMARLPPEFFRDYSQWCADERIAPLTTRYFIGAENMRLLLEHDEDFCSRTFSRLGADCMEMTADAADLDMNTAYYLDQVHYATNATAYMLVGTDQTAFIQLRARQCGSVADPIGCRVRITRTQIHTITRSGPRSIRR